ncbi:hypothetical protein J6590_085046 [Homalodisca vitripennis]|nr:hypothetical protein J6590_085046 [Homalodisca vitripennis]
MTGWVVADPMRERATYVSYELSLITGIEVGRKFGDNTFFYCTRAKVQSGTNNATEFTKSLIKAHDGNTAADDNRESLLGYRSSRDESQDRIATSNEIYKGD